MTNDARLEAIEKSELVTDWLAHAGWSEVLYPTLKKLQDEFSEQLVNHELGTPLPEGLTREKLAGKIYGIKFTLDTIRGIINRGERAREDFESIGIHIT